MRALEFIRGHVIFKLRYDHFYQMKTTFIDPKRNQLMEDWKFRCKKERDKKVLRLAQPRCWCHKVQTFQLDVLRHRCRKISMALRDKQRQTHSGTFIDNINSFLSFDIWIFLKSNVISSQSWLDLGRSNGVDFNWLFFVNVVVKFLWLCKISKGKPIQGYL